MSNNLIARVAIEEMVRGMVKLLVDEPEKAVVSVCFYPEEGVLAMDVSTTPNDAGKLIGKQGRTARAMRTILGAAGVPAGVRCQLNITSFKGGELEPATVMTA